MTGIDLLFQLFALLLGFSVAELLAGLARSWRIRVGATRTGEAEIRIGLLVPLLASLVLVDQTHFWLTAFELRIRKEMPDFRLVAMAVQPPKPAPDSRPAGSAPSPCIRRMAAPIHATDSRAG